MQRHQHLRPFFPVTCKFFAMLLALTSLLLVPTTQVRAEEADAEAAPLKEIPSSTRKAVDFLPPGCDFVITIRGSDLFRDEILPLIKKLAVEDAALVANLPRFFWQYPVDEIAVAINTRYQPKAEISEDPRELIKGVDFFLVFRYHKPVAIDSFFGPTAVAKINAAGFQVSKADGSISLTGDTIARPVVFRQIDPMTFSIEIGKVAPPSDEMEYFKPETLKKKNGNILVAIQLSQLMRKWKKVTDGLFGEDAMSPIGFFIQGVAPKITSIELSLLDGEEFLGLSVATQDKATADLLKGMVEPIFKEYITEKPEDTTKLVDYIFLMGGAELPEEAYTEDETPTNGEELAEKPYESPFLSEEDVELIKKIHPALQKIEVKVVASEETDGATLQVSIPKVKNYQEEMAKLIKGIIKKMP